MGVLLHALYRLVGPGGHPIVVPAPIDKDTPHAPWWWDHLASQAAEFRKCGFSAVLLPPACKSASGAAPDADGYGLYDNYDIGSKNQVYNLPTRYGDHERLRRMVSVMHACGLDVYADVVMHQYDGGNDSTYKYVGADGNTMNGRFPKHPSCFVGKPPRVPVDPVANPNDNFGFGDMVSYLNSTPANYMMNGAVAAGNWLTRTLDVQGYRIDDVKGMAVKVVDQFLNAESMAGRFAVGEYFDGNPAALDWWVWNSGMGGRCQVFDFALHGTLQAMCNSGSNWWMGGLQGAGYIAVDPTHAVTFVENPDTDITPGENIVWNKLLAYAFILTAEGYPVVYYKDYSQDAGCYGLKPGIDTLIWIHENLAFGDTLTRWGNDQNVYIFERQGYPGLLVGLNNDEVGGRSRTVQTSFGPNVQLHDYSGHQNDVWTDGQGQIDISISANGNGTSYVCYSRMGYDQAFTLDRRATSQSFYGAHDLDTPPVENHAVTAGRIWCDVGTGIEAGFAPNREGWTTAAQVRIDLLDDTGKSLANLIHRDVAPPSTLKATAAQSGWHSFRLTGSGLPAGGAAYELTVVYTGTQGLAA